MPKSRVVHDDPAEQKHPLDRNAALVTLAFQIAEEFGLPLGSVWLMKPDGSKADSQQKVGDWLNEYNSWDADLLAGVKKLIRKVEGRPCLNLNAWNKAVHVCRRVSELRLDETSLQGMCDWVDPESARPDELTDGIMISCDCLAIGRDWWLDTYFQWYMIFDPALIARSEKGDHSWVDAFLKKVKHVNP